jgi:hypothetical protein
LKEFDLWLALDAPCEAQAGEVRPGRGRAHHREHDVDQHAGRRIDE